MISALAAQIDRGHDLCVWVWGATPVCVVPSDSKEFRSNPEKDKTVPDKVRAFTLRIGNLRKGEKELSP